MIRFQSLTDSFTRELLEGVHDFRVDTFNLALYSADAAHNEATTAYSATNEVSGSGYAAGGAALTATAPVINNGVAYPDFANLTFAALTVSGIRSGLIYNASKSNRAVCVLDFGRTFTKVAQDFVVTFPEASPTSAIIRVKRA